MKVSTKKKTNSSSRTKTPAPVQKAAFDKLESKILKASRGISLTSVETELLKKFLRSRLKARGGNDNQMSTQDVADLLNVSRPFVVKLIDEKKIPATLVGSHRRVTREDAVAYKARMDNDRNEAFEEITRLTEVAGIEY